MTRPQPADKLVLEIATLEQSVRAAAEMLSPAQWLWRPDSGEWSMAQCVDHLNRAGYALLPGMEAATSPLLRLSLAACLEGTIRHQRYHWLAAQAVRANRAFPK